MAHEQENALEPCSPPPEYSFKWYAVDVPGEDGGLTRECVQECEGPSSCHGYASNTDGERDIYIDTFLKSVRVSHYLIFFLWYPLQSSTIHLPTAAAYTLGGKKTAVLRLRYGCCRRNFGGGCHSVFWRQFFYALK